MALNTNDTMKLKEKLTIAQKQKSYMIKLKKLPSLEALDIGHFQASAIAKWRSS